MKLLILTRNSYLRFYLPLTSVEKGLEGLLKTLTNQRKFLAILTNRENALSKLEDEPDASTLARIMSFSMTSNLKKIEEWTDKVFPFLSESMFNFQMEVNPINLRLIKPIEDSDKLSKALLSVNMLLFGGATRSDPELYFEFSISTETEWLRTFLFNSRPDEAKDDEEVPGQRRRRMTSKVEPERKQSRRSDSAARERRAKRIGLQGHRVLFHSQVDDSSAFEQCFVAEELLRMFIKVLIVSVAEGSSQYSQEQQMKHFLDFVDSEALEGLLNSLFSNQFISSKLFNRLPSWLPLRKFISATLKHRTEEFSPQLPSRIQENKPGRIDSGSFSTILGIRQFATMQGIGRKSEIYENDT